MTRLLLFLSVCLILGNGCTKLNVEETLPDVSTISPENMKSELDRINIISDSFDYMYVNYTSDITVSADIEYFGENGSLKFTKPAQIKIKGSWSTHNAMKPIGIVFADKINNAAFQIIETAQALPGDDLSQLQSIRLRNSGGDDGVTQLKDLSLTELAIRNSIDLELKYGKAVQVFVNGYYYGLLNVRTDNDRLALSDLLGVAENSITTMKMDTPNDDIDFREGDEQIAQNLIDAIENEDGYALHQLIDVENFIDYILFEDYVGNIDWPHNNARLYSVDGGKFRFLLYDLDWSAMRNRQQILPKMEYLEDDISRMYQILRNHDQGFIQNLETRQAEMYSILSVEKFDVIVDELASNIHGEIPYLIQRRGAPFSTFQWQLNINQWKQDFAVNDFYNRKLYDLLD